MASKPGRDQDPGTSPGGACAAANVAALPDDIERRLGKVHDTGPVHLIECADEALAALLRATAACAPSALASVSDG